MYFIINYYLIEYCINKRWLRSEVATAHQRKPAHQKPAH